MLGCRLLGVLGDDGHTGLLQDICDSDFGVLGDDGHTGLIQDICYSDLGVLGDDWYTGLLQDICGSDSAKSTTEVAVEALGSIRDRSSPEVTCAAVSHELEHEDASAPKDDQFRADGGAVAVAGHGSDVETDPQMATADRCGQESDPLVQEQEDLMRALLDSKTDMPEPLSQDDVVLFRLTRMSSAIEDALLSSESLAGCRQRVQEAGCKPKPAFAEGATCLIPITHGQIKELGLQLMAHHILALRSDKQEILKALKGVRTPQRAHLRPDHRAEPRPGDAHEPEQNFEIVEEHTFLTLRVCRSEVSAESMVAASAP